LTTKPTPDAEARWRLMTAGSHPAARQTREVRPRRGRLPLDVILALQLRMALRTALFLAATMTVIASLGLVLPVNRYYRTVDYAEGEFDIEVNGILSAATRDRVRALPGVVDAAAFNQFVPVGFRNGDRRAAPGIFDARLEPEAGGPTWFADATVVAGPAAVGEAWVDISAAIARALGVGPGDWIVVELGVDEYPAQVRRVMAIARDGLSYAALGPMTAALTEILSAPKWEGEPTDATQMLLVASDRERLVAELRALLMPPERYVIRTRSEALDEAASDDPFVSASILVAMSGLGLATLVGLALREGALLVVRRRRDLALLVALGTSASRVAARLALVEAVVAAIALGLSFLLVRDLAFGLVFAGTLPPRFVPALTAAILVAAATYLVAVFLATRWHLRRVRIMDVLGGGTAR
jgi:hypothetical protein